MMKYLDESHWRYDDNIKCYEQSVPITHARGCSWENYLL